MNIVNLGNTGQQNDSDLQGLPNALAQGMQIGTQRQAITTDKNKMTLELAKMQSEQDKTHFDNAYKMLTDLSTKEAGMSDVDKATWRTTPAFKEVTKVIKKYAPDLIADDGNPITLGKTDLIKDQLESRKDQIEQRILAVGIDGLSKKEKDYLSYLKSNGTDLAAATIAAASQNPEWGVSPEKDAEILKGVQKTVSPLQSPFSKALAGDPNAQSTDPKDPLGILKR